MADLDFNYQAFNADGADESGTIQARSEDQAMELLSRRGLTVKSIKQGRAVAAASSTSSASLSSQQSVSGDELAAFAYELSALLQAGMSLAPALELLVKDEEQNPMSQVTLAVLRDVRAGTSFSTALEKYPEVFPTLMSALVAAGEGLGGLDKALAQVSEFLENADKVRNKVISALAYPATVSGMAFTIITALFLFMVPRLRDIYTQIGVKIPPITAMMLELGQVADGLAIAMLVSLVIGLPTLRGYFRSERGRQTLDSWKLRLPLMGSIFRDLSLASFNKTLAILHTSGVPLHRAVALAAGASGNSKIAGELSKAVPLLQQGKSLAAALGTLNLYSNKMLGMLEAGEKSSNLSQMLTKMAEFAENRAQNRVEHLMALLEPMTIGLLGLMVGAAVLILGAPLMSLSSEIQ